MAGLGGCGGTRHAGLKPGAYIDGAGEIAAAAFGKNRAGKNFDEDLFVEKWGHFVCGGAGFDGAKVAASCFEVFGGAGHEGLLMNSDQSIALDDCTVVRAKSENRRVN